MELPEGKKKTMRKERFQVVGKTDRRQGKAPQGIPEQVASNSKHPQFPW